MQTTMYQRIGNILKGKGTEKPQNGECAHANSRWKRQIMVNSMQANKAPQEQMSAAWR